ncbi:hypothetical protein BJ973_004499 [Actinoplanes tereljensis]
MRRPAHHPARMMRETGGLPRISGHPAPPVALPAGNPHRAARSHPLQITHGYLQAWISAAPGPPGGEPGPQVIFSAYRGKPFEIT